MRLARAGTTRSGRAQRLLRLCDRQTGKLFLDASLAGSRTKILRGLFSVVILALALEMMYNGLTGRL